MELGSPPTIEQAPEPSGAATAATPAWERLETQIAWYDRKSNQNQRWFKRLKVLQIVLAAAIPVAAAFKIDPEAMGAAGALIVVIEGLQQLQQYQQKWTTYRSTCERLKHDKYLFLAHAGPYTKAPRPEALLAERVEGLVSQEHAAWVSQQQETTKRQGGDSA
jgi:uncharacterized protein DUF4231